MPRTRPLPRVHAGSPLRTNAQCNREFAVELFVAGMPPAAIAAAFPEVFRLEQGQLGQRYDYELADGSGRYETRYCLTRAAVDEALHRWAEAQAPTL
jgi:hypothetical protein